LSTAAVMLEQSRRFVVDLFDQAVAAVNGAALVRRHLQQMRPCGKVALIAVGKAACAMAQGAWDVLGDEITDALVVTKTGFTDDLPWPVLEAGHPLPDERSLAAGDRLFEFIASLPASTPVLFLLSGGASSVLERFPAGVTLAAVQSFTQDLLANGVTIHEVNCWRQSFSLIKGGRLAQALAPRNIEGLIISDIPGDDSTLVGSGPLSPVTRVPQPLSRGLVRKHAHLLAQALPTVIHKAKDFQHVNLKMIGTNADALAAAARSIEINGGNVHLGSEPVQGDTSSVAIEIAKSLKQSTHRIVHLWGGETTVVLPERPGHGGRNQQLALEVALAIAGQTNIVFLAAGSDGDDGLTRDAGAIVDGETVARGEQVGLNARQALRNADAGRFLLASGDVLYTGPTGTNVMDILIGYRY
jgi:glycerate 2-kinase